MPSVCFCKWSQTFFNGASRHPDKMPPQDLKMPSAIFPRTTTSHVIKGHQVSTNCHQYVSQNVPTLFLMVPLDILTKCHHKIWKCHQPFFHRKATGHALIQHQFSAKCHQCVSANDPRLFLMVPLDILTKCHHKIWKCHQPFFYKPLQVMPLFNIKFSAQIPSVCFCKWYQTFFNGASRHHWQNATTRFENAISNYSTNHN